jgi:glycosyltransferase involved in cell wall biosynthesis
LRPSERRLPGRRVAIVTQGLGAGGGVPTVARWLRASLNALDGYSVDIHDLATSRRDVYSRCLTAPTTLVRRSLRGDFDESQSAQLWGANLVELEPMRYHPRSELTQALRDYDLIQVVAGGPALAHAVVRVGPPVFLQVATRVGWERRARRPTMAPASRAWGDAMTAWTARIETKALAAVDGVLVENAQMLAFVQSIGQQNVCLAPPGVDTDRFHPSSVGWNADGYVLSVCRLAEPRKRLDRLVRAYRELVQVDASAPDLVLAGCGNVPAALQHLIDDLGLASRIVVRNNVSAHDLPKLYRGASVYVQTSDEEGLGISVLEAMASGLPVVATDTAGAKTCVADGVSGWLVASDDEARIAGSTAELVHRVIAATGREMAAQGRERCRSDFSTARTLERFTAMYDRRLKK